MEDENKKPVVALQIQKTADKIQMKKGNARANPKSTLESGKVMEPQTKQIQ